MKRHFLVLFYLLLSLSSLVLKGQALRMNEIQVIGSHNSYKVGIDRALMDSLLAVRPEAIGLDYSHIPITEQLDLGLRGLEIDVLHDPDGGRFSRPRGLEIVGADGRIDPSYNAEAMGAPGFKVLHVPDIDFRSHCPTFRACLADIRDWSKSHTDHLPIVITINPKTSGLDRPGFAKVLPFDQQVLDALDKEILEIFPAEELVTPRMVKGKQKTLRQAVLDQGWPALAGTRGKILLVLDADSALTSLYLSHDDNYHRPMFANADADHPHAAFLIMNEPVRQEKAIAALVARGFMVRTRSDADTREARTGDKTRFEAAVRSGAQVITTDYYLKSLSPRKDFEIMFDGKYSQCNPVLVKSSECKMP